MQTFQGIHLVVSVMLLPVQEPDKIPFVQEVAQLAQVTELLRPPHALVVMYWPVLQDASQYLQFEVSAVLFVQS